MSCPNWDFPTRYPPNMVFNIKICENIHLIYPILIPKIYDIDQKQDMVEISEILHEHQSKFLVPRTTDMIYVVFFHIYDQFPIARNRLSLYGHVNFTSRDVKFFEN